MSGDVTGEVIDLSTEPNGFYYDIVTEDYKVTLYTTVVTSSRNEEFARGIAVVGLLDIGNHIHTSVTKVITQGTELEVVRDGGKRIYRLGKIISVIKGNC